MEGSAAGLPASRDEQPAAGLRASDAERDHVVAKLRDEYVAGRLSHETFMHRVNQVLVTRKQSDLPPFIADLPPAPPPGRKLGGWLRGTWSRITGSAAPARDAPVTMHDREAAPPWKAPPRPTTSMSAAPATRQPFWLQFPRASGDRFTIGRDASCDLAIADMTVSRQHAQLERTDDGWLLSDLESTNGTRVNGWRVRGQVPVRPGDHVSFGSLEVIFTVLPPGDSVAPGGRPPGDPPSMGESPPIAPSPGQAPGRRLRRRVRIRRLGAGSPLSWGLG